MKTRYDESFLFPSSQIDFRSDAGLFPAGGLHGLDSVPAGYYAAHPSEKTQIEQTIASYQASLADAKRGIAYVLSDPARVAAGEVDLLQQDVNNWQLLIDQLYDQLKEGQSINDEDAKVAANIKAQAEAALTASAQAAERQAAAQQAAAADAEAARLQAEANARIADSSRAIQEQAAAAAAAAAQQAAAAAAAQQAAAAAAAGKKITTLALDADGSGVLLFVKYADGTDAVVARGAAAIDAWFKANGYTSNNAQKSSAYNKAIATTQTTATDTSSGVVQTKDTSSGTTTTANGSTGVITQTTATGQTVTGTGTLKVDGVITTVDQNTGTVTTENTRTGVVTQTDSSTGKTVTAVQVSGGSNTGGTFMFPDTGKTVTTTTPITGGSDAGKLALVGLLGLLLLRGAVR